MGDTDTGLYVDEAVAAAITGFDPGDGLVTTLAGDGKGAG